MRDYYYLTGLEQSPYDLTMTDVLHFGATGGLAIYTWISFDVELLQLNENKRTEDSNIYLRLFPETLAVFEKSEAHQIALKYEHTTILTLDSALIDDRYNGIIPLSTPSDTMCNSVLPSWVYGITPLSTPFDTTTPSRVVVQNIARSMPDHPEVSLHDLLCWTDDLESLVKRGRIQRRDSGEAPTVKADYDRKEYPPHLEALTLAWRKNWKNADPTDRSTCPKKDSVKKWLIEQGFSAKNADAGATIIKPQWATDKGW